MSLSVTLWLTSAVTLSHAQEDPYAPSGPSSAQPGPSSAQPGPPPPVPAPPAVGSQEALATELFNAAKDLMAQGKHADACPKLAESAKLNPKVGTLGKLAECEEQLGLLMRARTHLQQARNLARAQNDDRLDHVARELTRLDAIVPKLKVVLATQSSDLKVTVDRLALGSGSLGFAIPMDPGRHTVSAEAEGKKSWSTVVELKADGLITQLQIPDLEDVATPAPPPSLPTTPKPFSTPLRTAGIVATGAGAASLLIGGYFGVTARSKLDASYAAGCVGDVCTPAAATIRNDARDAGNLATIFLIAGGTLAAGGITLFLIGSHEETQPTPSLRASANVGPSHSALTFSGSF